MPCYHPEVAYRSKERNKNGKRELVFQKSIALHAERKGDIYLDKEILIPCGKCIGCKLERALQWTIRCQHESEYWLNEHYRFSTFITLTVSDEYPEMVWSVDKRHYQLFQKRLRKYYAGKRIPYFAAGGYGEELGRPHYHAILFGHVFDDSKLVCTEQGKEVYASEILSVLWPFGDAKIGPVNFETINYVCCHLIKILSGEMAKQEYCNQNPPFILTSRNPAIGLLWFTKHGKQLYGHDEIVIRDGFVHKPPRYYDKKFEELTKRKMKTLDGSDIQISEEMEVIKRKRSIEGVQREIDTDRRLAKEKYKLRRQFLSAKRRRKI
jgi:hypothetical protein